MQLADGTWTYNEIQVNLSPFVALKSDKKRGHGAFDTARIIQAFTPETVIYTGGPSPELWANAAAGMFLGIDISGSELTPENMAGAASADGSDNCRLNVISFAACGAPGGSRLRLQSDADNFRDSAVGDSTFPVGARKCSLYF